MSLLVHDIVKASESFQTSVNIDFDLGNANKIKNFIPTRESLQLLEEILLSVGDGAKRSRILIGAYGKGKSYIVLVLLSILSSAVADKGCYNSLIAKLGEYKSELGQYVKDYLASGKKLLPVVINGSSASLSQSFMQTLCTTLKRKDFEGLMPETHFEAAVKMIDLWEEKFPDTYRAFSKAASVKASAFKEALKNFDGGSLEEFEQLYPGLTSGSEFNPFTGFDVVDLYSKVSEKLPEYGYEGMFVVYDEFGKYLESSITKATVQDVKLLQDFAEKADRSGKNQLHLLLICHKEIENYIDRLPKQKVDGWRGVSERFAHIHLHNSHSENYELIGHALVKDEKNWNSLLNEKEIKRQFEGLEAKWGVDRLYSADKTLVHSTVYGCWPLHPVTAYILPRLSEKVAQNERTLFTFLSGRGQLSLGSLLAVQEAVRDGRLFLVAPDVLYDYFAQSMQNEPYTSEIKQSYMLSEGLLQKCEKFPLDGKIIKSLTLVYVLKQFERLQPSADAMIAVYEDCGYRREEVIGAIENLTRKLGLVYERASSNRFLQLKEASGIDVPQLISDTEERRRNAVSDTEILNRINTEKYLYPASYNTEHAMTRFYEVKFVESENAAPSESADGTFFALLDADASKETLKRLSAQTTNILYAVPKKSDGIHDMLRKYDAASFLENQNAQDRLLLSECEIIKDDLFEGIKLFIHGYTQPERNECSYFADGEEVRLYRKSDLTEKISEQMSAIYKHTPRINNEMLNKNVLTGQARNSRIKLLDGIFNSSEANLGLKGNGQEVSFMRSCLTLPKILITGATAKQFDFKNCDKGFRTMLKEIEKFVKNAKKKEVPFEKVIEVLTRSEKGIGLRYGVIPVYLAVVLQGYAKNVLLRSPTGEVPLCSETLCDAVENPDDYTLSVLDWNDGKERYERHLEKIFKDYVLESEKQKVGYEYLFNAILRWYRALPKFAKQTRLDFLEITDEKSRFINTFRNLVPGVQDFLFVRLPKAFGQREADPELSKKLEAAKQTFDTVKTRLEASLIERTKECFSGDSKNTRQMSLGSAFNVFKERLSDDVQRHIFENDAHKLFSIFEQGSGDEYETLEKIAVLLTGLKLDDWADSTVEVYFSRLDEFKNTLLDYVPTSSGAKSGGVAVGQDTYSISFANADRSPIIKSFAKVQPSRRAQVLGNEIKRTLEEMGQSISEAEKRQVLIDLLEGLC